MLPDALGELKRGTAAGTLQACAGEPSQWSQLQLSRSSLAGDDRTADPAVLAAAAACVLPQWGQSNATQAALSSGAVVGVLLVLQGKAPPGAGAGAGACFGLCHEQRRAALAVCAPGPGLARSLKASWC